MKKPILAVIPLAILFAALGSAAFAVEKETASCTLTYKESVNVEGPCTFFTQEKIMDIQGIAEENGQKYLAVIDLGKKQGLLIGAGTFTLADGKLAKIETDKWTWPNGYVLTIKRK